MQLTKIHTLLNYRTLYKQATCAVLVIAADFLFYHHPIGWTLGMFGAILLLAMFAHNRLHANLYCKSAFGAAAGLALSLIEAPTVLGGIMFSITAIACVLLTKQSVLDDARVLAGDVWSYVFRGWFRLQRDSLIMAYARKRRQLRYGSNRAFIRNWLLPVGLSAIFIMLFAQANPIVTGWLSHINWGVITEYLAMERMLFWIFIAFGCWALIRPKMKQRKPNKLAGYLPANQFTFTSLIFNERSIFTSLIMFNGLFFIQNIMDVAFLWSGITLPEGMSYAEYAHQGAYPLMVTALLAAVFVLIALKPDSATEDMPVIRALVYGWVGQNVFLVISAIMRLAGYVGQYSLTWLRVEAFIWMGLVALGLVLIVARIYFKKTNIWLINSNSFALYAILYLCCFINFGGMIADYNVQHCTVAAEAKCHLDVWYLQREVGVEALPAIRQLQQAPLDATTMQHVQQLRTQWEETLKYSQQDWRRWTFRNWRLAQNSLLLTAY